MNVKLPSKNIKSTVAFLEHSNIEWQSKFIRLTEQLNRSESQSRNYLRELTKCQKMLYEAGSYLFESILCSRKLTCRKFFTLAIESLFSKNLVFLNH